MSLLQTLGFIAHHPLNRSHKAAALLRFLRWQLGTRLLPGAVVFEWVNGARVVVRRGDFGMTQNIYCGLHDFHDMAYLLHVLASQDLFVDIGANIGSYTVLACAARGARGYCFEPTPAAYRGLLENIAINDLSSRVTALNIGISDHVGELRFTTGEATANHVLANEENADRAISVPVRPLDAILQAESPSLLKIDVEGFEAPVIEGARKTLAKPSLHSVIMELNGSGARYGYNEDKILRTMQDFGFSTFDYDPFTRTLIPLNGKNYAYGNTLFVRNPEAIAEKLAHAPSFMLDAREF
jgi:FkbM family methyltransferase